jgi:hypothetical protein
MTRPPVRDIAASVRQRLLNEAQRQSADFQRLLVRYGVERLLYRLSQSALHDRFVLKGAMLFTTWANAPFRATGDLDLLGIGPRDIETTKAFFMGLCAAAKEPSADGLVFLPNSVAVESMREEEQYPGLRVRLESRLKATRIPIQIDIGFGDAVHPDPLEIDFPCLLPELPAAHVRAYPPETVVAEKFEAMVRFDALTGRLKDHYDLWAISRTFSFRHADLAEAIAKTFSRRQTKLPETWPGSLTDEFAARRDKAAQWAAFLQRSAPTLIPPPFPALLNELRTFLTPIGLRDRNDSPDGPSRWTPDDGWIKV